MATSEIKTKDKNLPVFNRGDLVQGDSGTVVLCTGVRANSCFSGTAVHSPEGTNLGENSRDWEMRSFSVFTGSVTLTQD